MSALLSPAVIEVRLWGGRVGAIAADPSLGCYAFEYDRRWVASGVEVAPLTMALERASRPFVFPGLSADTYRGLPGLISDSLPDEFGNALVDAWMAQRGMTRDAITTLDRLAYMGKRGLGALEFHPAHGSARESAAAIDMKKLVETARRAVTGELAGDREAKAALDNIIRVGTSAGGARAKAVVAWNQKTDELRSGQFAAAPGFEHWLIKFDGVAGTQFGISADYGRIEYAYSLMARAAGIEMAPCRLLDENGRSHFMTKRFDRERNRKHHVLTLCGMVHMDFKQRSTHAYEQYFDAIGSLGLGDEALQQAFSRTVFNVLTQNCDDHPKNFAFVLKENGRWTLAPAYDMSHAHNSQGQWTNQHLMSVAGKFRGIGMADLLEVADRFRVASPRDIVGSTQAAVERWEAFAEEAGVRKAERDRVAKDLAKVRLR